MEWVWFALIAGIIAPWIIGFRINLLIAFREGGLVHGLGYWLGMCWITVPIMLFFMWVIHKVIG
jgi:hypothetical protein